MNTEEYIKKWLAGSLSEAELQAFRQTADYAALEKLQQAVQGFKAPAYDVPQALAELNKRKTSGKKNKLINVSWGQMALRVAAVVVMALLGYYFIFSGPATTTVTTSIAEKTTVQLPDNSGVTLNALSSLSYSENNWQEKRLVKLTGEAFFTVAKGARFDVQTAGGVVSVLGTEFNVNVRENYFEVVCFTGLVAITAGQEKVQLPAGHLFRIADGVVFKETGIKATSPGWLANESSFVSVPYKYVLKELERQYQVTVVARNIDLDQLFTGRFTHKNLELALKSISLPLNLQYKKVGEHQIELSGDSK